MQENSVLVDLSKNALDAVQSAEMQSKIEWAVHMRRKFTPSEMLNEDGSLNHEYFKPKQNFVKLRKWTDRERKLLMRGIEKYGIGNWQPMRTEFLSEWEANELRIKTSMLLGRQSLALYKDWKGDEDAIDKEYQFNFHLGKELNCWKGGVLVADEDGKVLQRIQSANQSKLKK